MKLTSWTKRIMVGGLVVTAITALIMDVNVGKELCTLMFVGFIGIMKSDD